jgi:hypothetical protein
MKLSNYPLIVTDSPFVLAKVYGQGLIGCLVASPQLMVSSTQGVEPNEILCPIESWLAPEPKTLYLITEKLKRFCDDGYYTESIGYQRHLVSVLNQLKSQCQKLSSRLICFTVDQKTSGTQIANIIKQHEAQLPILFG